MEDIIQVLFYVAIAVIAIVSRTTNKEKPATPSPRKVLEEAFPNIETKQHTVAPEQTFHQTEPAPIRAAVPDTPPQASRKPIQKVRINTRREARKAFIHSEIFNRKY